MTNILSPFWLIVSPLTEDSFFRIAAAFFVVNFAFLILWAILIPRKYRARSSCNIIFLRGFHEEARADVPNRVLPCIGCYGRIMWARNVIAEGAQDQLGKVLTDSQYQKIYGETWQVEVTELIKEADLAVIDFSDPHESLMWEIGECLKRLPVARIILIVGLGHSAREYYKAICQRYPELWNITYQIPVYPSRFIIPLNVLKWWLFQFERRMYACMMKLAADDLKPNSPSSQTLSVEGRNR
ncbi:MULTISPECIES: hypothetical protein [unclassified Neorhizobium]|uniref:hypothetical protein n=1 Tax=unclassified Neorhizobium TaxID=2629175 RepID=UPI001FF2731B|nr:MULTISPECIES: hypothetical protein [unclassified Neorhizobium]MCJ9674006.1 hypothetical protein [Neorhizobium sp. SHOUNA12B]MCJ9746008.1 hypothetical protein [Neorhizobium sp. SHOUNA12A]